VGLGGRVEHAEQRLPQRRAAAAGRGAHQRRDDIDPAAPVHPGENLGRALFTVRFDGGQQLIVFAHEIEFASEELAA